MTGRDQPPEYITNTETQREYQDPNTKSVTSLKRIEENQHGRHAYKPDPHPPTGICKYILNI